ncbi:MAG: lytic murein transglycosylase [Parcubacteria group bacterium]|nr:lytic murein transglycosylase [Parcubacteria group bacterium]
MIYDIKPPSRRFVVPEKRFSPFVWERFSCSLRHILVAGHKIIAGLLIVAWGAGNFAQAPGDPLFSSESHAVAAEEPTQAELERKLKDLEAEIEVHEKSIRETQAQGKTLQGEISQLNSRIRKLNLQIQAAELEIKRISRRVTDTTKTIEESELKISKAKGLLERSLRAVYESDQVSLLEVLLVNNALSEFFAELSAQHAIQVRTQTQLDEIKVLKEALEAQKEALLDEKEDQVALLLVQDNQRKDVGGQKNQKDQLLAVTKGKEVLYQQLLKQSQKSAAEVRAQLYKLLGGGEIKFEDALRYAEFAASNTSIRPALLLAVMDKESDFGSNVGRCSWKTAMHPTRDQPAFSQITRELGLDPDLMLVSCPIVRDGSYGGAMGIAQFLPSTWLLYKERVQKIVGRVPSPWNPQDAFVATAAYLADSGATSQSYEAERRAAAKYYAGKRWARYLRSYGDRVMRLAQYWQEQINILKRTASL